MPRVKRGFKARRRRNKVLKLAKGFRGARSKLFRSATEAVDRALNYAFRDRRVRKRDVSFGPRTQQGKQAWDTFATLLATTKKLGVSFYRYIYDRVSMTNEIPKLADLIVQRAQQMNLAASWQSA